MRLLLLLLMIVASSSAVSGEIYKWVDDQGKVHFSDNKPITQPSEQVKLKINSYTHVTVELELGSSAGNAGSKKVIMYSTAWCAYCKKAKRFFKAEGIAYTEYDIEKSESAKKAYDKLGGRGVPVILVGKSRMNGFSELAFMKLYEG